MESHRQEPVSGETPSSPANPKSHDSDFEFGSLTPDSPSQDTYRNNSPADLFFNGRLLPHAFPTKTITSKYISRTSSEDSSRSNSTKSQSSSCSPTSTYTPRTSSSSSSTSSLIITSTDQKSFGTRLLSRGKVATNYNDGYKRRKATEQVTAQLYASYSQRWQYITPLPAFKREGSVKRKSVNGGGRGVRVGRKGVKGKREKEEKKRSVCRVLRWWRRLVRAVVLVCRECHAMEPRRRDIQDGCDVIMREKSN